MYTIIMNENKELVTTKRATLYQREKLTDKIQFLFPQKYNDVDLNGCTAILKYIDQGNIYRADILAKSSGLYKDKIRFILPVDTRLNYFAGDVLVHISLVSEAGNLLETGEALITINPVNYVEPSDDFVNKLISLEAQMNSISENQIDGLKLTDDYLQVSVKGEPIGEGVNLLSNCECEDNVVEFESSDGFVESPDEDNVVEF